MFRKLLLLLLASTLLAAPVRATWSILVLDTRTGEIVIASATCVDNSDLLRWTPVVIPGVGVAVCQAASPNDLKVLIHERMLWGHSPERIQTRIEKKWSNVGGFQYAILDMQGRSLLFTGGTNGAWAGGVTGQDGDLLYAIQGNVLAGPAVVDEAEQVFLQTQGDLGQRVMAAMEAAMVQGGDGRCSCSIRFPDNCGTPPPSFNQSATIGYFVVSRPGDTAGDCTVNGGCANGSYYLVLNEPNHVFPSTDPVILLRQQYDAWRAAQSGRPDAFESLVVHPTDRVDADAQELLDYWVELYDVEGVGLTQGGASFALRHLADSSGQAVLENVIDHQDGSYTLQVRSGGSPGLDRFAFAVDDGGGAIQLGETLGLIHDGGPPAPLNHRRELAVAGNPQIRDAQLIQDGAALWLVADAGAGWELMRSARTLVGDYDAPTAVAIDTVSAGAIRSLWIAENELAAVISLLDADGIERLYETARPDTQSAFAAPDKLGTLDEGFGAADPSLSPDRLTIYYSAPVQGTRRVHRATRLDLDAVFFPGQVVTGISSPSGEGRPELLAQGELLAYDRHGNRSPRLHLARRDAEGAWQEWGPIAGAHGLQPAYAQLAGWSDAQQRAWTLSETLGGVASALHGYALSPQSLLVAPETLSVSQGGNLLFQLDAGASFGNASYQLFLGLPGSGLDLIAGVLPLRGDRALSSRFSTIVSQGKAPDMEGILNAGGAAQAQLVVPAQFPFRANLIGRSLSFAALILDGQGTAFVSSAAQVELQP